MRPDDLDGETGPSVIDLWSLASESDVSGLVTAGEDAVFFIVGGHELVVATAPG